MAWYDDTIVGRLVALQLANRLARHLGRLKALALQQQRTCCIHQLEVEQAVFLAVLFEGRQRHFVCFGRTGLCRGLQAAQAHGAA